MLAKGANKAGGRVVLVSLQGPIREIFDMAGFSQLFPMYASAEEAMRSF